MASDGKSKLHSLICWKCKRHLGFVQGIAQIRCTSCRAINFINTEELLKNRSESVAQLK